MTHRNIYRCTQCGFGDKWSWVSFIINAEIQSNNKEIFLNSKISPKVYKDLTDILNVLDIPLRIIWTEEDSNINTKYIKVESNKDDYIKTKIKWNTQNLSQKYIYVSTQFKSPNHHEWNKNKNLSRKEIIDLELFFNRQKIIKRIPIGLPMTLSDSIKMLSVSNLFLGIDSGMSHVAHSVGVPIILKDWKQKSLSMDKYHPNKEYYKFLTLLECKKNIWNILQKQKKCISLV